MGNEQNSGEGPRTQTKSTCAFSASQGPPLFVHLIMPGDLSSFAPARHPGQFGVLPRFLASLLYQNDDFFRLPSF